MCRMTRFFLLVCVLLGAAGLFAQVAPTSEFQLDGTAAQNLSYPNCLYGPCDYWNLLNGNGGPNPTGSPGSSAGRTFINGEASTLVFIGGGSKDPNDLTSWSCTSKSSPNKDTLTNGYAAGYTNNPATDLVLVFGADRLSTNGDANIGIWFFQQNVHCDAASGTFLQADGTAATHVTGDIFVVSAFTVGGTTPTITVYMWNPACLAGVKNPTAGVPPPDSCADTNLQLLFSVTASCDMNGTLNTAPACAITNTADIQVSWPYPTAGSSTPSTIPAQAFFTGGVDITYLLTHFGGLTNTPCFGSILEETRSSQTTSAVLKDFINGSLNFCKIHINKACSTTNPPQIINNGTQIQYTFDGTIKNVGIGTLTNITLSEGVSGGTVTGPTPTTLNAGQSATYSVVFNSTALTFTNTATASGNFGSQVINSENTASATCNETVSSVVAIAKHCAAPGKSNLVCSSSGCFVTVPITAQVCNNGSTQLTNIQVADNPATLSPLTPNGFTLNPGQCTGGAGNPANPAGTYKPTAFDPASDGVSNGRFLFDDTISVTSATPALGSPITAVQGCPNSTDLACSSQACPLCPQGECSTSPLP